MGGSSKKVVVGTKYYLGFHMVLCHYPITALTRIIAGERLAWSGNVTSSQSINIDEDKLFGGDRKEGGIEGKVDVLFGEPTQAQNAYLQSQLGSDIPAFRGTVSFVANRIYIAAGSPYIKNWWPEIVHIPQTTWYSATANINSGSANGVHIIRECLLNEDWGLGLDETDIDDTSFRAAALTLFNENFGISMLLNNQDQVDRFIQEVLKHIQGVIYTDRSTGKYVIKLIRDDYTPANLTLFDESNIISLDSYDKPSPSELLGEIIVKYRPRGAVRDAAAAFQNLATIESQGAIVSQTVNYPGIDNHSTAARMAARELRQQSARLSKVKLTVNRDAWEFNVGDVFRFSWAALGIDQLVMRINSIDFGTIDSPNIKIDALEDVFALSDASYLEPEDTSWTDPLQPPAGLIHRRIEEMNWWDLSNTFDPANLDLIKNNSTASYINYLGIENVSSPWFEFWSRPQGGEYEYVENSGYVPDATLVNDITHDESVDIQISGLDSVEALDVRVGQYAIIDDEYVRIDAVNVTSQLVSLGRGCNDTVPASHSAGTRIWFAEENMGRDITEYTDGETVEAEARVETGSGLLDSASAPDDSIVVDARQHKPYPPGRFQLNGEYYPEAITGELTVSWAHRDRLQQTASIIDHTAASIGPEASVTYTLQLYDENNVLRRTETGLTGTSYTWTTEEADSLLTDRLNNSVRVVLKAVRGGVDSWQSHDYTVQRAGYGYQYGKFYGGI